MGKKRAQPSLEDLQPPPLRVQIRILDDGRVVFADLPADLAEVVEILGGVDQSSAAITSPLVGATAAIALAVATDSEAGEQRDKATEKAGNR